MTLRGEWETSDSIPDAPRGKAGRKLSLAPGEILKRKIPNKGQASRYNHNFESDGRHDYHAREKHENGQWWLYIWRDSDGDTSTTDENVGSVGGSSDASDNSGDADW